MSVIKYQKHVRQQFTYHGLLPSAILQLRAFSRMECDTAEAGEGLNSLVERGVCKLTGEFTINRLEAQTLVSEAYREGWHQEYGK